MSLHTNYFFPYNSESAKENSLTRAFFSLVRLVPPVGYNFYSLLYKNGSQDQLTHPLELQSFDYETEIQQQRLPDSNQYVSVLIGNEKQTINEEIKPSERTAIYDAVFTIGNTTFFVENKPYDNIGHWQLCPSKKDINSEECEVLPKAISLTWKEIISFLNSLNESNQVSDTQKLLIDDFLTFVDTLFVNLNPYDRLDRCKSKHLVERRVENIFRSIAADPASVGRHQGWAISMVSSVSFIKHSSMTKRPLY